MINPTPQMSFVLLDSTSIISVFQSFGYYLVSQLRPVESRDRTLKEQYMFRTQHGRSMAKPFLGTDGFLA